MLFKAKFKNYTRKAAKIPTVPFSSTSGISKNLPVKQPKKNRRNFCGFSNKKGI